MAFYDVAIVGAGIIGLGHALAAAKRGKSVIVIDRDNQANGASIRNFGFVTVTGQGAGDCWEKARRSRDVWLDIVEEARIPVLQRGMVMATRFDESKAVLEAFMKSEMGAGCSLLTATQAQDYAPALRTQAAALTLYSPHEVRVESREAIPQVTRYLAEKYGVTFQWNTSVVNVEPPEIETSSGMIAAETAIVCPGDNFTGLFPDRMAAYGVTRCKLQMLRVRPTQDTKLKTAVMSDLGLGRYLGYSELPEAAALKVRLDRELRPHRENGIHLIVTQSADGSLVVGDSHHYATTPDPFSHEAVDDLILQELDTVLDLPGRTISERWIGTYASASDRWRFTDKPDDDIRIAVVTSGCGASTAFAIGEETIDDLFGSAQ